MSVLSWINEWNNIIRDVLFADKTLKELMLLPEDVKIMDFINRYFIRAGYTSALLTDEKVRIVYAVTQGTETRNKNVLRNMMTFDIYVKTDEQHNCCNDRLISRTELQAARLIAQLTQEKGLGGYKFQVAGDWDLGTRTTGYARYQVAFYYLKVY